MSSREELEGKKVTELKEECTRLGLATSGKKADLIERILAAGGDAAVADAGAAPAEAPDAAAAPAEAADAARAGANGADDAAHASGKHQRIEFNLGAAAEPAPGAKDAHKIIKLGADEPEAAAAEAAAPAVPVPAGAIEAVATLTAEERKKLRGEKFGMTEDDKKKKRAQRFGLPDSDADEEKKRQRRERFGNATKEDEKAALNAQKAELMDPAKLKARAERFGVTKAAAGVLDEEKKKARAARFRAAA